MFRLDNVTTRRKKTYIHTRRSGNNSKEWSVSIKYKNIQRLKCLILRILKVLLYDSRLVR